MDSFQFNQSWVLVLEFCNAGDLGDVMAAKSWLSEKHARLFLHQIILAICNLDDSGIVHRDLKLDNILLHLSAEKPRKLSNAILKIADFGSACNFKQGNDLV